MLDNLSIAVNRLITDNEIIMMGDFNLPDVLWDLGVVACPINTVNQKYVVQQLFLDFFVNLAARSCVMRRCPGVDTAG